MRPDCRTCVLLPPRLVLSPACIWRCCCTCCHSSVYRIVAVLSRERSTRREKAFAKSESPIGHERDKACRHASDKTAGPATSCLSGGHHTYMAGVLYSARLFNYSYRDRAESQKASQRQPILGSEADAAFPTRAQQCFARARPSHFTMRPASLPPYLKQSRQIQTRSGATFT